MDKQEILDEINKTEEHLANMKKMLEKCEDERWKPQEDERYYFINSDGKIDYNSFEKLSNYDAGCYNFHNCFKTYEEAEQEANKTLVHRQLEDIAKRLNKGKKICWSDQHRRKYYITWCILENTLAQYSVYSLKTQGTVYCLDENFLNVAKREIGENKLIRYIVGE